MPELETDIETKFCNYVTTHGDDCLKLNIGGRRGFNDRLVLMTNEHLFFIELKRKDEKARPLQKYIHRQLRKRGFKVYVSDSYEKAKKIYQKEKRKAERNS